MIRLRIILALLFCLACSTGVKADPVVIPLPIETPVFVSITANPLVQLGPLTFDFTSSLNNEFISFRPWAVEVGTASDPAYRVTIGIRARDGLASLTGLLPPSPVASFINVLPSFPVGTTDVIFFDLIIAGAGTTFTFTITDLNGDTRNANLFTPVPEPATIVLLGTGLAGTVASRRRRKRKL